MKNQKRPLWLRALSGAAYLALCAAAIAGGMAVFAINTSSVGTEFFKQQITKKAPREVFNANVVTILFLGCDEDRYYGGKQILSTSARSDMMLMARIDFENNKITGLSIPRDIVVQVPGFPRKRINGYHALGGKDKTRAKELAKMAVEYLLPVKIDRVVEINYGAFQSMIDMVGGVDVFVDKRLKYTDRRGGLFIDLQPGQQTLDGYNAMCYVRYRKGDNDFQRQDRQKTLMMSFKDKLVKNPMMLGKVADQMTKVMGEALTVPEMVALARFAQSTGNDNIKMGQIPVTELEHYDLAVDEDKLPDVLARFNFARDDLGYRKS
jgi:polyisoprenyl-teichoic acid--peptidoglycan teichoic acid transferase